MSLKKQRRCQKLFQPSKIPRYLPGSVPRDALMNDLKMYNRHRFNCFCAEPHVDCKPPKMNPHNYIKLQNLENDSRRFKFLELENQNLIQKINAINRTKGTVDCWNPIAYDDTFSNWKAHAIKMRRIVEDNVRIYEGIQSATSAYTCAELKKQWQKNLANIESRARFPLVIYQKQSLDVRIRAQPSVSGGLEQLCNRPKVYMDLQVKNGVTLGRIIIELYADYAPVTVQNFLSICKGEHNLTYKNCPIHRIIKGQYLETGDITKGNGKGGVSIFGNKFAEEKSALKHTKFGVLSMIRIGDKENNSQFSISFRPLEYLDGKRVVFGHVIKGNANLVKVDDLGRKIGAPSVAILIVKCGEIKDRKGEHNSRLSGASYASRSTGSTLAGSKKLGIN